MLRVLVYVYKQCNKARLKFIRMVSILFCLFTKEVFTWRYPGVMCVSSMIGLKIRRLQRR